MRLVGVIADTHGLLRPEAVAALHGCDLILHAGDVGRPEVLDRLREIAPVVAVRGNVDRGVWADALPLTETIDLGRFQVHMLHERRALGVDAKTARYAAVIYGHSHRAEAETDAGVLYLNPGSAGPRRFRLPVTLARLDVSGSRLVHEMVALHE